MMWTVDAREGQGHEVQGQAAITCQCTSNFRPHFRTPAPATFISCACLRGLETCGRASVRAHVRVCFLASVFVFSSQPSVYHVSCFPCFPSPFPSLPRSCSTGLFEYVRTYMHIMVMACCGRRTAGDQLSLSLPCRSLRPEPANGCASPGGTGRAPLLVLFIRPCALSSRHNGSARSGGGAVECSLPSEGEVLALPVTATCSLDFL